MKLFLLSFLVITLSVAALAFGVIVRKRPISAGCGKLSGPGERNAACEVCAGAGKAGRAPVGRERPVGTMGVK